MNPIHKQAGAAAGRRQFMLSAPLTASVPLAAAFAAAPAAAAVISDAELQHQMLAKLTAELADATTAATETGYLNDVFFAWQTASVPLAQITAIVAFSFGYRAPASGATSPAPGPVNGEIAAAVYQIYRAQPVVIYAQAEVAAVLASVYAVPAANLQSIAPASAGANGAFNLASVDAVVAAALAQAGSAQTLGTVAIVTHVDQAQRALVAATNKGIAAATAQGVSLPLDYDSSALPAANRRRDLYLLNDITNRFASLRLKLIAEEYPNG